MCYRHIDDHDPRFHALSDRLNDFERDWNIHQVRLAALEARLPVGQKPPESVAEVAAWHAERYHSEPTTPPGNSAQAGEPIRQSEAVCQADAPMSSSPAFVKQAAERLRVNTAYEEAGEYFGDMGKQAAEPSAPAVIEEKCGNCGAYRLLHGKGALRCPGKSTTFGPIAEPAAPPPPSPNDVLDRAERTVAAWPDWMRRPEFGGEPAAPPVATPSDVINHMRPLMTTEAGRRALGAAPPVSSPVPRERDMVAELQELLTKAGLEAYFVPPPGSATSCGCSWPNGYPGQPKLSKDCPWAQHARLAVPPVTAELSERMSRAELLEALDAHRRENDALEAALQLSREALRCSVDEFNDTKAALGQSQEREAELHAQIDAWMGIKPDTAPPTERQFAGRFTSDDVRAAMAGRRFQPWSIDSVLADLEKQQGGAKADAP